ncbi:protein C3orf33 [Vespa velutina]|uniref:protein C3orf33 n=1 Tax=Vespa velutina TaxID=202808 RepID=UPI001FB51B81|nr:protein C3orf33 [Vespa velutina]
MEKEKMPTVFQKFTIFMEQNNRAVVFISYGITGISLLFALYKIRPFAKFKKPSDVPRHFLRNTELQGRVARIDPSYGTLLLVDHKPLIPFPRFGRDKYLPIKLAGINTTNHGISWLQIVISGKNITFLPLVKKKDYVNCIVTFSEKNQKSINIAEELVKLGFGSICNDKDYLLNNESTLIYYKSLVKAEKFAQFKRNGYWHLVKKPTFLWKVKLFLSEKLKSLLPIFVTKQLNI